MEKKRILFAGYAPVHFVCFLPMYERLAGDPRLEIWLTGGFRRIEAEVASFALEGFYDPFPVDQNRVIPLSQAQQEEFDVVVCAHTSDQLFPKFARKKVQIFHGVSFKNLAISEKVLRYDFVCLPGDYHASGFRDRGLVRSDGPLCVETGFAKMDAFFSGALNRERVLDDIGVDPGKPTLLYAPTGGKKNSLETMGERVIQNLAEEKSWNLLVKPHDHPKKSIDWFSKLARYENERVRLIRERDIIPFLYSADLLLSDASSVAVEFTLLDRPIVFLDVPKLIDKAIEKGTAIDLGTYGRKIGSVAKKPKDVVAVVRDALANPDRESGIRTAMARDVFFDPGRASDRVAEVILFAAGLRDSLPSDARVLKPETQ